jgi:hypothetical protein
LILRDVDAKWTDSITFRCHGQICAKQQAAETGHGNTRSTRSNKAATPAVDFF